MASNWIKMEYSLWDKPEVFQLVDLLGIDRPGVIGRLFRVWCWFDSHTTNGAVSVTIKSSLDRIAECDGFIEALEKVGWCGSKNGCIYMVNFDRHLSKSAKRRALHQRKVCRLRDDCNVTKTSPDKSREEKRRISLSKDSDSEAVAPPTLTNEKRFVPPTVEEVAEYSRSRGKRIDAQRFVNFYESKNWMVGKNKMTKWKAAVVQFETDEAKPMDMSFLSFMDKPKEAGSD